jgi:glycosyltransferase involved in cell wall biosynthesis
VANVLYISYTGILEPLGESQVLQYLERLSTSHSITLVSFEKSQDWIDASRRDALCLRVRRAGITWRPLRYPRLPPIPGTAYALSRAIVTCRPILRTQRIQIIHARGYVPALMALTLKAMFNVRFLFDMRGFWPDEKVDAGTWRRGSAVYRAAKRLEREALLRADTVVSLTHSGVQAMKAFDYLHNSTTPFEVIPTCTNLEAFHPPAGPRIGPPKGFRLGYVGNVTGWYDFGPVVTAFETIRRMDSQATLTIINKGQHEVVHRHLSGRTIRDSIEVKSVHFEDIPSAIREMDATAFFLKPLFSKLASLPTKLGEFLASGVPCLVNDGPGDMSRIVRDEQVGIVVDSSDRESVERGALRLMEMALDSRVRDRCVQVARKYFSLTEGAATLDAIYHRLASTL